MNVTQITQTFLYRYSNIYKKNCSITSKISKQLKLSTKNNFDLLRKDKRTAADFMIFISFVNFRIFIHSIYRSLHKHYQFSKPVTGMCPNRRVQRTTMVEPT